MAGQVRVSEQVVFKPAALVPPDSPVRLVESPRYVSRGGEKLEAALLSFNIDVKQRICADVGASTGGFTDCLLQHGASLVYAIDVGSGILDWKLRQDPHVVVIENTNARFLNTLPQPVSLVTMDASFISIKTLLPVVVKWFADPLDLPPAPESEIITLIKPQFEAGRAQADRAHGIIRDPAVHRQVLLDIIEYAHQLGWNMMGLIPSPLLGAKGNREFLGWFKRQPEPVGDIQALVASVIT